MDRNDVTLLPGKAGRGEVFAWALYDWANSAYSTISITLLAFYLQKVVFPGPLETVEGVTLDTNWGPVIYAWGIALSMLVAAVLSPIVGAMADANSNKRRWLAVTALGGSASAILLAVVPPERSWLVVLFFFTTSLLFELSLGFYNGFLPEIADEQSMDVVSAWGYGLGYVGGALPLILSLVVLNAMADKAMGLRVGLLIMGCWWGVFSLPALFMLRDRGGRGGAGEKLALVKAARVALREVGHTLGHLRDYRMLVLFLVGFLLYNDGVQTVLSQSSTFAIQALRFNETELIQVILMIQFIALPGAMLVGHLSKRLGQKSVLMGCLGAWVGLLMAAYFVHEKWQFWALGAGVALVMGGTQSVSRAIMGMMTPRDRSAEFFGFFNLSGKATSFLGTFMFGLIIWMTGSARLAIVSILVFFIIGWTIVARINVAEGRRQAMKN